MFKKAMHAMPILSILSLPMFSASGCQGTQVVDDDQPSPEQSESVDQFIADRTAVLCVKGLSCPFCVQNVDKQLASVSGVDLVYVDLPTGKVRVLLSKEHPASQEELAGAIASSGFTLDHVEMP